MQKLFYYKKRQKFITKWVRFFITKCDSFITNTDSYYKLRRFYHKMLQLLQDAMFITNCDSTVFDDIIKIHLAYIFMSRTQTIKFRPKDLAERICNSIATFVTYIRKTLTLVFQKKTFGFSKEEILYFNLSTIPNILAL